MPPPYYILLRRLWMEIKNMREGSEPLKKHFVFQHWQIFVWLKVSRSWNACHTLDLHVAGRWFAIAFLFNLEEFVQIGPSLFENNLKIETNK